VHSRPVRRPGDRCEVPPHRGLVDAQVERRDHRQPPGPGGDGVAGERDRVPGGGGADVHHHPVGAERVERDAEQLGALGQGQPGELAGRAREEHAVDAAGQPAEQRLVRSGVQLAVGVEQGRRGGEHLAAAGR
jgi:hypothetical protein